MSDLIDCSNWANSIACSRMFGEYSNKINVHNFFPNKPLFFTCLQYKSFENTVGKGEIACNEQFLLFP